MNYIFTRIENGITVELTEYKSFEEARERLIERTAHSTGAFEEAISEKIKPQLEIKIDLPDGVSYTIAPDRRKYRVDLLHVKDKHGNINEGISAFIDRDLWRALSETTRSCNPNLHTAACAVLRRIVDNTLQVQSYEGFNLAVEEKPSTPSVVNLKSYGKEIASNINTKRRDSVIKTAINAVMDEKTHTTSGDGWEPISEEQEKNTGDGDTTSPVAKVIIYRIFGPDTFPETAALPTYDKAIADFLIEPEYAEYPLLFERHLPGWADATTSFFVAVKDKESSLAEVVKACHGGEDNGELAKHPERFRFDFNPGDNHLMYWPKEDEHWVMGTYYTRKELMPESLKLMLQD